jgi:2,3-bisphosphoglycerate-dependent phosphoglycerate mutase
MLWRRSFDVPPPPIDPDNQYAQNKDPKYSNMAPSEIPLTECLKDVVTRVIPYWKESIIPELQSGKTVLIVAHGNSLRALIKYLEDISDDDIAKLNLPTGIPLLYKLDENFKPIKKGGDYLDPDAAAEAIAAVANQGKK